MMKFFRQMVWVILLAGLLAIGQPAIFAADTLPVAATSFPLTLTDGAGRVVKLAAAPRRIISLSPAATDVLVKVGANAKLVGVTRYGDNPAIVESRVQRLGGVLDPDYEGIVALKPDLVVTPLLADKSMQEKLSALGLTFIVLHPEGLAGVLADIRLVGRATGHDEQGEETAKNIEAVRALVMTRWKAVPEEKRPRVLIRMEDNSPAPGSYVDDLLAAAGGRNVLPRGPKAWVAVSPESVLQLNPDLIVDIPFPDPSGASGEPSPKLVGAIPVKTLTDGKAFYRPGPDVGAALWQLARAIYPALFPEAAPPLAAKPPAR
jgi:iron complex transport system substrate-binding protein